jgi:hypothetical protein
MTEVLSNWVSLGFLLLEMLGYIVIFMALIFCLEQVGKLFDYFIGE